MLWVYVMKVWVVTKCPLKNLTIIQENICLYSLCEGKICLNSLSEMNTSLNPPLQGNICLEPLCLNPHAVALNTIIKAALMDSKLLSNQLFLLKTHF